MGKILFFFGAFFFYNGAYAEVYGDDTTKNKTALIQIGLTYENLPNKKNMLEGPANDLHFFFKDLFLPNIKKKKYAPHELEVYALTDHELHKENLRQLLPEDYITYKNEISAFTNIDKQHISSRNHLLIGTPTHENVKKVLSHVFEKDHFSNIILQYSGHGTQVDDRNGDEADKKDEALALLSNDKKEIDALTDDELKNILSKLENGKKDVGVFSFIDACHSHSILDLDYSLTTSDQGVLTTVLEQKVKPETMPIDVVCFSGCADSTVSFEKNIEGYKRGVFTYSFLEAVKKTDFFTLDPLKSLIQETRKTCLLHQQEPKFSTSFPLRAAPKSKVEFFLQEARKNVPVYFLNK